MLNIWLRNICFLRLWWQIVTCNMPWTSLFQLKLLHRRVGKPTCWRIKCFFRRNLLCVQNRKFMLNPTIFTWQPALYLKRCNLACRRIAVCLWWKFTTTKTSYPHIYLLKKACQKLIQHSANSAKLPDKPKLSRTTMIVHARSSCLKNLVRISIKMYKNGLPLNCLFSKQHPWLTCSVSRW